MKFVRLISSTLILATAFVAVAPAAHAVPDSLTGKGTVQYIEDTSPNPIIDPEDPENEIQPGAEIEVNPDGGAISIDAVSNLDFGEQEIGVSATPSYYKAKALETTDKDGAAITRGHFVQWTDKRSGTDHTYEIKAAMTQQFTNGTSQLTGATITYANPLLNSAMPQANWPTGTPATTFTLAGDAAKAMVLDNSASTGAQGLGTYVLEFGTSAAGVTNANGDAATGLAGDSVELMVPAGLSILEGEYTADITWTIEYTPAP